MYPLSPLFSPPVAIKPLRKPIRLIKLLIRTNKYLLGALNRTAPDPVPDWRLRQPHTTKIGVGSKRLHISVFVR